MTLQKRDPNIFTKKYAYNLNKKQQKKAKSHRQTHIETVLTDIRRKCFERKKTIHGAFRRDSVHLTFSHQKEIQMVIFVLYILTLNIVSEL